MAEPYLAQLLKRQPNALEAAVGRRSPDTPFSTIGRPQRDKAMSGYGGIPRREPYPSELEFFRKNPRTAGMAADDNRVILNPFSGLSPEEQDAVVMNESARVLMRQNPDLQPKFSLTPAQQRAFAAYGPPDAQAATIAARILSKDPSALEATSEQLEFVGRLRSALGLGK